MIRRPGVIAPLIFTLILAALAGCRTQTPKSVSKSASSSDKKDEKRVTSPAKPEVAAPDSELAPAVAHILRDAGRNGSLIYRSECGPRRIFREIYPLNPTFSPAPMDQALTEIGKRYPNIRWNEAGTGLVRITDRAAYAGLLQVRIPEFILLDDRGPDDALAAVWNTPEVRAWLKKTGTRIMRSSGSVVGDRRASGIVAIHLKNVTVTEILDAILVGGKRNTSGLWSYRECGFRGRTTVEISIR